MMTAPTHEQQTTPPPVSPGKPDPAERDTEAFRYSVKDLTRLLGTGASQTVSRALREVEQDKRKAPMALSALVYPAVEDVLTNEQARRSDGGYWRFTEAALWALAEAGEWAWRHRHHNQELAMELGLTHEGREYGRFVSPTISALVVNGFRLAIAQDTPEDQAMAGEAEIAVHPYLPGAGERERFVSTLRDLLETEDALLDMDSMRDGKIGIPTWRLTAEGISRIANLLREPLHRIIRERRGRPDLFVPKPQEQIEAEFPRKRFVLGEGPIPVEEYEVREILDSPVEFVPEEGEEGYEEEARRIESFEKMREDAESILERSSVMQAQRRAEAARDRRIVEGGPPSQDPFLGETERVMNAFRTLMWRFPQVEPIFQGFTLDPVATLEAIAAAAAEELEDEE